MSERAAGIGNHQSARHAGKSPINQNGKGGANPGHDGKSYMTLVTMRPSPGGLRSEKGGDRNAQQRHWRTRSILPSLSPRIFHAWFVYSATVATDREVHRGPPPGASGEGGSSLHGPISAMHRTQRAPFDEKHAKDGHDSRGRNYKAETQLPTFAWASLPI